LEPITIQGAFFFFFLGPASFVCVGLIMRVEEPSISMDGNATWCV
jgi:hypothetical protein